MSDLSHIPLDRLIVIGGDLFRRYVDIRSTALLKSLAQVVVELRQRNAQLNGHTDWAGRTEGYRVAIAEVYSRGGMPTASKERHRVEAALRYHVGNLMRKVAPADELAAVGLKPEPPKERVARHRARYRDRTADVRAAVTAHDTGELGAVDTIERIRKILEED